MYCSHLSALEGLLNDDQIQSLESYFSNLIGGAAKNITVSKLSRALEIPPQVASRVLTKCKEIGIINVFYTIRCPECGMLIKKVDSIADIPSEPFECYGCNEEIEVEPSDIELVYALENDSVFTEGQQEGLDLSARAVVPEDSMESIFLAGNNINEYLFHPTDEEYEKLKSMYKSIKNRSGTTKKIGDTLEDLTEYLFNLCSIFKAAGIRTSTNQIDCCVRNRMYLKYGILDIIGGRFFIECKNEGKTPSGGYMSKLHSIIANTNSGENGRCIKFGIIISKEKAPSTYKDLAVKYYLNDGIVIISICGDELKNLFDKKGNLLDLIERKANEIMIDSTTDLVKAGLYES
jgi:hypothetical protein